jgi:hypothetical protein
MCSGIRNRAGRTRIHTKIILEINVHSILRANAGARNILNEIISALLDAGFGENIAVVRRHGAASQELVHHVGGRAGRHAGVRGGVAVETSRADCHAGFGSEVRERAVGALKHALASFGVRVVIGDQALCSANVRNRVRESSLRAF